MKPNYIQEIVERLEQYLGKKLEPALGRAYAQLVLTTGVNTTLENVHDAWSAWKDAIRPDHQSLVPFDQLTPEVQEMDRKYAVAIATVATDLTRG